MPLYPFILLGAIFLLVVIVPPLVSAYLDQQRESYSKRSPGSPDRGIESPRTSGDEGSGSAKESSARRDDSSG